MLEHGKVTSVEHKEGVVFCSVQPIRENQEYPPMPVLKPHSAFLQVPEQGDFVAIDKLDDGTRFITHSISKEESWPDSLREGELAIQLDSETQVHFKKRNDGKYNVDIAASGDVTIDGDTVEQIVKDTVDGSNHSH